MAPGSKRGCSVGRRGRTSTRGYRGKRLTGFNGNLEPRWRFVPPMNAPVTVVTTSHGKSKVYTEEDPEMVKKPTNQCNAHPMQAMWARSLGGLRALTPICAPDKIVSLDKMEYTQESLELPLALRPESKPTFTVFEEQTAAVAVLDTLNNPSGSGSIELIKRKDSKKDDSAPHTNGPNPTIELLTMAKLNREIRNQEDRVMDSRRRLEAIMKTFK